MCCKGVSLSIRCGPCVRQQQTLRFARQGSRLLRAFNVANFFYLTAYSLILVNADAKSRGHAIFFGEEHNDMIAWVCSITGSLLFLTTSVLGWFEADLKDANGCGGVRGCILRRLTWSHLHAFLFFLGSVLNVTMELVPMEGARRGAPRVYNYDNQAMLASTNSSRHSLPLESFAGMRLYILSIHGGAGNVLYVFASEELRCGNFRFGNFCADETLFNMAIVAAASFTLDAGTSQPPPCIYL
jgi:hypothetical protein